MNFSTREIAVGVWTAVTVFWALSQTGVRQSIGGVVRAALPWKIFLPGTLVLCYIVAVVWGFSYIGLWSRALLKSTILWALFSGLALSFSGVQVDADVPTWRGILKGLLKATILLTFVVNTYTFDLWVELLLVPTLVLVGLLDAVARLDEKHERVAKLTGAIQIAAGLGVLAFALGRAFQVAPPSARAATESLLLGPVLSLSLLPLVYVFFLIAAYEQLFLMLSIGPKMDSRVPWYARRRLAWHLGIRRRAVRAYLKEHRNALRLVTTRGDVDELVS